MQQDYNAHDTVWRKPGTKPVEDECFRCGQKGHHARDRRTGEQCTNKPSIDPIRQKRRLDREAAQTEQKSGENGRPHNPRAESFLARSFPQYTKQQQAQSQTSFAAVVAGNARDSQRREQEARELKELKEKQITLQAELQQFRERTEADARDFRSQLTMMQQQQAEQAKENAEQTKLILEQAKVIAQLREAQSEAKVTDEQHAVAIKAQADNVATVKEKYISYSVLITEQVNSSLMRHAGHLRDLEIRVDSSDKQMSVLKTLYAIKGSSAASNSTHPQQPATALDKSPPAQSNTERQLALNLQAHFSGKTKVSDSSSTQRSTEKASASINSIIATSSPSRSASAPPSPRRLTRSAARFKRSVSQQPSEDSVMQHINFTVSPTKTARKSKKKAEARQQKQQQKQLESTSSESPPRGEERHRSTSPVAAVDGQDRDKAKQPKTTAASIIS
jgi:hypothetical protein